MLGGRYDPSPVKRFSEWMSARKLRDSRLNLPLGTRQNWSKYILACSHRRHGKDKTVLSCPCRRCEHNLRQNKTILSHLDPVSNFQVFSSPQYIWDRTVANWKLGRDKTKPFSLVANFVQTLTRTRQDKFCLVRVGGVNKLLLSKFCVGVNHNWNGWILYSIVLGNGGSHDISHRNNFS